MKRSLSFTMMALVAMLAVASFAMAQESGTEPAKSATPAQAAPAKPATPAKHASAHHKKAHAVVASATKTPMVDLNSATKEDLMKLPGVGDATAEKIIAGRPWTSKMELVRKGVVTKTAYAKIRTKVTAKQAKSS